MSWHVEKVFINSLNPKDACRLREVYTVVKCPYCGFEGEFKLLRNGSTAGGMYTPTSVQSVVLASPLTLTPRVRGGALRFYISLGLG
jgi:hypothetical protein